MNMRRRTVLAGLVALVCASKGVAASVGPSTGLPIPRFVSLKAATANIRRGPSMTHRVDWVFQHQGMPLIVTAEYGHWRRVEDRDGMGGWVHYALLSGNRTVIVDADLVAIRSSPEPDAPIRAEAERGVVARLGECAGGWCQINADGRRGWVTQDQLWGVTLPGVAADAVAQAPG
jgi:SH3-like domain-containing protein